MTGVGHLGHFRSSARLGRWGHFGDWAPDDGTCRNANLEPRRRDAAARASADGFPLDCARRVPCATPDGRLTLRAIPHTTVVRGAARVVREAERRSPF